MIIDFQGYRVRSAAGAEAGSVVYSDGESVLILRDNGWLQPTTWKRLAAEDAVLVPPEQQNSEVTNGEDAEADQPDKG